MSEIKRYNDSPTGIKPHKDGIYVEYNELDSDFPFENIPLEAYPEIVRGMWFAVTEACKECPYHPITNICEPCEVYKALIYRGETLKIKVTTK